MATAGTHFRRFAACSAGATAAEYAICTALLVAVAIAAMVALGGLASGVNVLNQAAAQHSGGPSASLTLIPRSE